MLLAAAGAGRVEVDLSGGHPQVFGRDGFGEYAPGEEPAPVLDPAVGVVASSFGGVEQRQRVLRFDDRFRPPHGALGHVFSVLSPVRTTSI